MQSRIFRLLVGFALVIGNVPQPGRSAAPATAVCGTLAANTTWLLASSPYTVCANTGVTVPAGLTLTIEPGVSVQFAATGSTRLHVAGALAASGTLTQPITFTGASTVPGSWGGLAAVGTAITPAVVSLSYVTLDYGGQAGSANAQVFADHAAVTITHSLIQHSAGHGVYVSISANLEAHFVQFVGNAQNAIQLNQPSTSLLLTDLAASGNGANGVFIEGTADIQGQQHWTAPGIPYIVNAPVRTSQGDFLTIDPGNTLEFTSSGSVNVGGGLSALGTPSQPITFTGQTQAPGSWTGLVLGSVNEAVAQLDYVTLEYGGSDGANIRVTGGRLIVHHSLIRYSAADGVRFDSNAGSSIMESHIVSNTLYGMVNSTPQRPVQASNDWWGDPSGPDSDVAACTPAGLGAKVTAGVFFQPVLTSTTATVPFPLSNAPIVTLTPRRWFAPADGLAKIYFDITVRDGNGAPLSGRTVHLSTSLGQATAGGITDQYGKTLAFLTSGSVGDADVFALLTTAGCEGFLAPEAKVTFTTPVNVTDLFPDAPAPYVNGNISLSPRPIIVGVPTLMSVKLTNPLTVPITVDASFGFARASIGLAFGPIHDFVGQVIPANSSVTLSAGFVPPVSGHFCVQVSYSITGVGSALAEPAAGSGGFKQHNDYAVPGPTGSADKGDALTRTRTALDFMHTYIDKAFDTDPLFVPLELFDRGIDMALNYASIISGALAGDPPRQDYQQLDTPHKLLLPPVQPGGGLSPARAAALNAVEDALAEANADGRAAATALDRSGGAAEAGDLQWESLQAAAVIDYNRLMGTALISASLRIDDLLNIEAGEGLTSAVISTADVISLQQHLAVGFDPQQISDAHAVGLTDADLEGIRQQILAANPADVAGDMVPRLRRVSAELFALGNILVHPFTFNPGFTLTGGHGLQTPTDSAPAAGNTMTQLFNSVSTIQLANPLTHTALIDVKTRRIDLPGDWAVEVSPAQISLAPGQQTTVTVSIFAGAPVPQGSLPSVAVEGYAGAQLLGGVVVNIVVPHYVAFDGKLHVYLPVVWR